MQKKTTIVVILIAILLVNTAYASPNTYQQVLTWAEQKSNEAKYQLTSKLHEVVEAQKIWITRTTDEHLYESNHTILAFGQNETVETAGSINKYLYDHKENLNATSQGINEESMEDFNAIVERVNLKTDKIVQSVETDYHNELSELSYEKWDQTALQENSTNVDQRLKEEIQQTQKAISELKKIQASEPNQAIKRYIQKKINFLNDLVFLLADSR